jgi:hypothetical protein
MLAALAVPYLGFGAVILTLESTVFWTIIISLIMVFMLFLPRTVLGDKLLAGAAWILLIGLLNFANGQRNAQLEAAALVGCCRRSSGAASSTPF